MTISFIFSIFSSSGCSLHGILAVLILLFLLLLILLQLFVMQLLLLQTTTTTTTEDDAMYITMPTPLHIAFSTANTHAWIDGMKSNTQQ